VAQAAFPRFAVDAGTLGAAEALLATDGVNPILERVVGDLADDLRRALAARHASAG